MGEKMKYSLNKKLEEAFGFKQLANEKTKWGCLYLFQVSWPNIRVYHSVKSHFSFEILYLYRGSISLLNYMAWRWVYKEILLILGSLYLHSQCDLFRINLKKKLFDFSLSWDFFFLLILFYFFFLTFLWRMWIGSRQLNQS